MEYSLPKNTLVVGIIIAFISIGLLSACGDNDSNGNRETGEMEVTPQTQQQDKNTRNSDMEERQTFEASLSGSNQVPEAVDTDASGNVTITLLGDSIRVEGEFSNLSSEYMASHIHMGAEGESGDPVQPLAPELGEDQTSGTWNATYQLDEELISALQSDSLYVNVHSSNFTGGEIRGQLTAATKENM